MSTFFHLVRIFKKLILFLKNHPPYLKIMYKFIPKQFHKHYLAVYFSLLIFNIDNYFKHHKNVLMTLPLKDVTFRKIDFSIFKRKTTFYF